MINRLINEVDWIRCSDSRILLEDDARVARLSAHGDILVQEPGQAGLGRQFRQHDGEVAFTDTRTTHGSSGSFTVMIVENDGSGTDNFKGRAKNLSTGEVCGGTASL